MTEKPSCLNCKNFEIKDNFYRDTGQKAFKTSWDKCGWEYMIYHDTKENRDFFSNIYCNNWEDDSND